MGNKENNAPKTLNDVREMILKSMESVSDGSMDLKKAKTLIAQANAVVGITKLELTYYKHIEKSSENKIPVLGEKTQA